MADIRTSDGKVYHTDEKGRIISVTLPKGEVGIKQAVSEGEKAGTLGGKAPQTILGEPAGTALGSIALEAASSRLPFMRGPIANAIKRTISGFAGGALGSHIGGEIDVARGVPEQDIPDPMGSSAINQAFSEAFRIPSFVLPRLGGAKEQAQKFVVNKFLKPDISTAMEAAEKATPEITLLPTQRASKTAEDIAHALIPREAEAIVKAQQPQITRAITRIKKDIRGKTTFAQTSAGLAEGGQKIAKKQLETEAKAASGQWEKLGKEAEGNKITIRVPDPTKDITVPGPTGGLVKVPGTRDEVISGPIDVSKTRKAFKNDYDAIKKLIEEEQDPLLKSKFSTTLKQLDNLFEGPEFKNYEFVKELRTAIGNKVGDITKHYGTRATGLQSGIRAKLKEDMIESMKGPLWKNSTTAVDTFNEATGLTKSMKQAFNDEMESALTGNPTEFFKTATASPESIRQFNRVLTGDVLKKDPRLGEYTLNELLSRHEGGIEEGLYLKAESALKEFRGADFQNIAKESLSGRARKSIEQMLLVASRIDPKLSNAGVVASGIREGGLVVNAASGSLGSLMSATIKPALMSAATGLTFFMGAKDFARKAMDPAFNDTVKKLLSAPTSSKYTQALTKGLFSSMKGAQVYMQTPNGEKVEGKINKEGKWEPTKAKSSASGAISTP